MHGKYSALSVLMSCNAPLNKRRRGRPQVVLTMDPKSIKLGKKMAKDDGRSLSSFMERLILKSAGLV